MARWNFCFKSIEISISRCNSLVLCRIVTTWTECCLQSQFVKSILHACQFLIDVARNIISLHDWIKFGIAFRPSDTGIRNTRPATSFCKHWIFQQISTVIAIYLGISLGIEKNLAKVICFSKNLRFVKQAVVENVESTTISIIEAF